MSRTNTNANKPHCINTTREGIRIVRAAAFCFAIISWVATAQGMQEYVFVGKYWQAYLISFAIQSILFVFNLKLPEYIHQIGERTQPQQKNADKPSRKKRLHSFQVLIVAFYATVLVASSFFSFVYIANYTYRGTQYIDADVVLDREYRKYLDNTDNYVTEYSKLSRLILSDRLSELQAISPHSSSEIVSKDDLVEDARNKREQYNVTIQAREIADEKYKTALEKFRTPISDAWRGPNELKAEEEALDSAREELQAMREKEEAASTELDLAELAVENYTPSIGTAINEFLTDLLKTESNSGDTENIENLKGHMEEIYSAVIEFDSGSVTNFPEFVTRTQALDIALDNYLTLRTVQGAEEDNSIDLDTLKTDLLSDTIPIPDSSSDSFEQQGEAWRQAWNERFRALETILKSVPTFSVGMGDGVNGASNSVDLEFLENFDALGIARTLSRLTRSNLSNINAMERACRLLVSEFPFLAWFSLLFAFFLDISSLLAGLFIYLTGDGKYRKKKLEPATPAKK